MHLVKYMYIWVKGMQGYMLRLLYIYWYWILPNKQKLALVYVCEHHKPFLQCPFASYTIYIFFFYIYKIGKYFYQSVPVAQTVDRTEES